MFAKHHPLFFCIIKNGIISIRQQIRVIKISLGFNRHSISDHTTTINNTDKGHSWVQTLQITSYTVLVCISFWMMFEKWQQNRNNLPHCELHQVLSQSPSALCCELVGSRDEKENEGTLMEITTDTVLKKTFPPYWDLQVYQN